MPSAAGSCRRPDQIDIVAAHCDAIESPASTWMPGVSGTVMPDPAGGAATTA